MNISMVAYIYIQYLSDKVWTRKLDWYNFFFFYFGHFFKGPPNSIPDPSEHVWIVVETALKKSKKKMMSDTLTHCWTIPSHMPPDWDCPHVEDRGLFYITLAKSFWGCGRHYQNLEDPFKKRGPSDISTSMGISKEYKVPLLIHEKKWINTQQQILPPKK